MRFWLQVNELLGFDIGFLEGQGCPTRVPVACFKPWFCLDHGPQPLGFIYMFPSAGAHLTILTCFVHFCAMFCALGPSSEIGMFSHVAMLWFHAQSQ